MKTMAEQVAWINEVAKQDIERAQGMLDMLNDVYGTDFAFLARRVVFSPVSSAFTAGFYADCHDAYAALTIW